MIHAALLCLALLADPSVVRDGKRPDLARGWLPTCHQIAVTAAHMGVPADLAVSTAWHESRLDRHAVGLVGEVGPLQVRPETWCRSTGRVCRDPITAGVRVLGRYLQRHGEHAVCRYRGAKPGCASERLRRGMAARLSARVRGAS